jgi:hypothetical protein
MDEAGPSTGWDTTEDMATVIAIHPDAHLVCDNTEIADLRSKTFQRSDAQGWMQRGHPNMVVRAAPTTPHAPVSTNPFSVLGDQHD